MSDFVVEGSNVSGFRDLVQSISDETLTGNYVILPDKKTVVLECSGKIEDIPPSRGLLKINREVESPYENYVVGSLPMFSRLHVEGES